MKYRVVLLPLAEEALKRLHPRTKVQIREAFDKLRADPYCGKSLRDELDGHWRYRVLRYRILYKIDGNRIEVVIVAIGQRSGIYDWFLKWVAKNEKA